jgi:pentatricopeptide repeat protein
MMFRTMNEGEVVPDINTYSYLVHTFGKLNKLEEIYVLLREMESSNVLLEIYTK